MARGWIVDLVEMEAEGRGYTEPAIVGVLDAAIAKALTGTSTPESEA